MKFFPAFSTQSFHHFIGRSKYQGQQSNKINKANRDKWSFDNVAPDFTEIKELIQPQIEQHVHKGIEKSKQTQHSPEPGQLINTG